MQEDDEVDTFDCSSPLSKGGLNQIFICSEEGCDSRFSKRSYLEQHMCIHTNERFFVCSNDGCIKSYKRKDHLNRHMRSCPSSERIKLHHFPCTAKDCEHEYTTDDHLRKTNRDSHTTKKKTFTCLFAGCSQTFKKHQDLKSHKFDHTQKNPFQCPHPGCEMSFRWMNRLKRHTKIHDGYSCPECEQTFEKWTLLLKHKSSAHKADLACPICSKTFPQQRRLNVHMKVHSEERLVYECPREGCVRYYSEKRNLDAHIRSYHDGSRVPCTHESCTRTFAFKHKMLDHLKSHSLTRKIKKKFPKKGHQRRNVVSLLTGLKCKNEAGTKESSDNDDLLLSNETKSFSTTPSCDWGGYSEILGVVDNTGDPQEENSPLKAIEIPDENSDHGDLDDHLSDDLVPETIIDVELYKDKCVSNTNCREVPDSFLPKIGNDALDAKSQTNSINLLEVTIDLSDNCSLTNTNSKQEPTESPQIYKDHFTSTSSSGGHLQVSKTPKLSSVTLTGLRNNEIKISDQSLKFIVDDQPMSAKDDSMNELQIIGCELGPNLNRFKCAPYSQSSLSGSLLMSRHTTELRSFPCPRKNCQNVYTVQRKLDLHLKCDHDGLGFQCKYANCGMVFDSERSLGKHFNMHCVKMRRKRKRKISDIISENVII